LSTTLSPEQLANGDNFVRQFHLRSVNVDKREFVGIALPYGETVDVAGVWPERHENSVVESDAAKVFWEHSELIGRIIANTNKAEGWDVVGRISKTQRGDEALALMADGAADGLSVWFEPLPDGYYIDPFGVVVFTRVRVLEVTVCAFPQYPSARVRQLRSRTTPTASNQEESTMTDTTPAGTAPATPPAAAPPAAAAAPPATTPDAVTREDIDTALGDFQRSMDVRMAAFGRSAAPASPELPWRSAGELLRAIANGDEAAHDFHRQWNDRTGEGDAFRRAYTGGTTADGVDRSTWVGTAIRLLEKQRKVINTFQRAPLPPEGMTLEYGVIDTNTVAVAKQAAEGDDLTKGQVTLTTDNAAVETFGGWSELTVQQVKRSSVDMLDLTNRAQGIEYGKQTEAAVRSFLIAQVAAQITAGNKVDVVAAPDLFGYLDAIVDSAELFEDRGFTIDGAYVSKATFKLLYRLSDNSDRMVFNIWGSAAGGDLAGSISFKGLKGDLANVQVKLLAGAPTKFFTFYDELALTTWEEPGAPLKLQDENVINLSRQFSSYGAIAYGLQFPKALLPLKYAA
jgi:uncharacterized protein